MHEVNMCTDDIGNYFGELLGRPGVLEGKMVKKHNVQKPARKLAKTA